MTNDATDVRDGRLISTTVGESASKARTPLVWLLLLLPLLSALVLAPATARADDEPSGDAPAAEDAAEGATEDDAASEPTDEQPARPEIHKLYVPFKDLQAIFQKEGEGVFLPYPEFKRLWDRAHTQPADRSKPPVGATVRSASYVGTVDGEMLRLEATLEIEVLGEGWQRVPLPLSGLGIEEASLDGKAALLVPAPEGYALVVREPGTHELKLVLRGAAPAKNDTHVAAFSLPPVPLAKLAVTVPGRDTVVTLTPRLASTTNIDAEGRTQLLAFLGPVSKLQLSWRRRPEDGPQVDPLVFADQRLDVRVDRGIVRTVLAATLGVHRAPLSRFSLKVPADAVVLFVRGDGMRTWTRSEDGTAIEVVLRAAQKEAYAFQVGLERALAPPPVEAAVPLVSIEGMERERGYLRVQAADGVKVEPLVTAGLLQVDLPDLPKELQGAAPGRAFGYRFPARPESLQVRVSALEPRVRATVGHRLGIRPETVELRTVVTLDVDRAGIFDARFALPEGLEVVDVKVNGAELDDWSVNEAPRVLEVTFRDRVLGRVRLFVRGRQALEVPEAEGQSVDAAMPLLRPQGAEHVRGFVAVQMDPALDRRIVTKDGLTTLDEGVQPVVVPPSFEGELAALPWVFRFEHRDPPYELVLGLERKAPTITCAVEVEARLEPDRTRLEALLRYHVQFRGVDTFRFAAPLDLAERLHLEAPGLQLLGPEAEAEPEDAPAGWEALNGIWTVKLPGPRTGPIEVRLTIDDAQEETLASGATRSTALPRFVPLEVEGRPLPNVTHHVAVRRDPLLEVEAVEVEGGEEIDTRELPATLPRAESFLAFRSYAPEHRFVVAATKHDIEPVADLVVTHMHLDTVVPHDGRATTEAYLVVRNNDRQYLELRLPGEATIRAVRVAGTLAQPRVGEAGTVLIPLLSGLRKDQAFDVAIVYEHDVERDGSMFRAVSARSPEPVDVENDLLTWHVFLPDGDQVTGFGGSVEPRNPPESWAARLLARVGAGFVTRDGGRATDWNALVGRFESPFGTAKSQHVYAFQGRRGTGEVRVTRIGSGPLLLWKLFGWVFGAVAVLGIARFLRGRGLMAVTALLLVLFALLIPAGHGFAAWLTAAFVGACLAALVWGFVWCLRAWGQRPAPIEIADDATPPADPPAGPAVPEGGAA